ATAARHLHHRQQPMLHRTEKPVAPMSLTRERVGGGLQFALLLILFVTFFGVLLASVFELFRFADFLLRQEWTWGWPLLGQASLMFVVGVVVVRIAWWLSLAILGLVTRKYEPDDLLLDTIPLDPMECPDLYDRVDEICRRVKSPRPDEIRLNPLPQCYVVEQRRFSLSTKRSLTLVVGLPQILVFTMAELRVILVHEMAHFGSGDTTLTVFLFRFVESLRRSLLQLHRKWWHWVDPFYWVFALFYAALYRVALPLQRRLELRADRISAALCGGDLAAHTLLKDWFLDGQFDEAVAVWRSPETIAATRANVFQLFADRWRELSPDAEQYLAERLAEQRLRPDDDPHPSTRDRLAIMRQFPPVDSHDGQPALTLLPRHQELERAAAELLE
ncbi:MAG: M48 family metallopeptidase, partial [Planctomycetota bacterium]